MSNILKVTTSIGGYDNANTIRQNPETQTSATNIQGPIQPDKVVRPDARSDAASQEQQNLKFQYETNFDSFLQQLKSAPVLTQELPKLFQEYRAFLIESGIGENYAAEMDRFLNMIDMEPSRLQQFLKTQSDSAIRFSGSFFSVLRQILNQTKSVELKNSILNFLKKYTDMAESESLLQDVQRNLQEVKKRMFPQQREQLEQLEGKLNYTGGAAEHASENLKALKQEILPFINAYISEIHERGVLRDATAQIAELISRYENGTPEGVKQAFDKLMDFQMFQKVFQNFDASKILEVLSNTEFERASKQNLEMDQLAELLCKGARGEAGAENKTVFQEMIRSLVLNESVYMPLLHFMVPICSDGRLMFSEVWIDPDAKDSEQPDVQEQSRVVKGLVKFDVQDLGFFDLFFVYSNQQVNVQLNIPRTLEEKKTEIREQIRCILEQHSLKTQELMIGNSDVSIPITEAFANLKERKRTVNVSI